MIFSPQVHIVFNSREEGRITEPILENAPHKLYYFTARIKSTGQEDVNLEYMEKNIKAIQNQIPKIEIETIPIDYVDYIEVIQEISKIVKKERDLNPNTSFYINVATGSKITAIASVEAAKIWNLEYYYVYSTKYDPFDEGPIHKGEYFTIKPRTYPMQRPRKDHIQTLKLIEKMVETKYRGKQVSQIESKDSEKFIYMKNLIRKLESTGIIVLDKKNKEASKKKSALYMKVKDFLTPLEKSLGYIHISKDTRNRKVTLTEDGLKLVKIFRYLD